MRWFRSIKERGKRLIAFRRRREDPERAAPDYRWVRRTVQTLVVAFSLSVVVVLGWNGTRALLNTFIFENDAFALNQFDLETNGHLPKQMAMRWSGVKLGENIFSIDLTRVRRNLETFPLVRLAQVERVIPNRLRVRLREHVPILKAYSLSYDSQAQRIVAKPFLVDRHGYVFSPGLEGPLLERQGFWQRLPELTGATRLNLISGRVSPRAQVHFAIQTILAFERSALTEELKIRSIDPIGTEFLMLNASGRQQVRVGRSYLDKRNMKQQMTLTRAERDSRFLDKQFRRWALTLQRHREINRNLLFADLSVKDNVPYRWAQLDDLSGGKLHSANMGE